MDSADLINVPENPEDLVDESLREERRRTGRYVAAGISIFVSLFGAYQVIQQGTPEYAILFLPVAVMCMYILWLLHSSKQRSKTPNEDKCTCNNEKNVKSTDDVLVDLGEPTSAKAYSRSYSVA